MNCLRCCGGVDLNLLPETERARVDRLLIESQPGHVQTGRARRDGDGQARCGAGAFPSRAARRLPKLNSERVVRKKLKIKNFKLKTTSRNKKPLSLAA